MFPCPTVQIYQKHTHSTLAVLSARRQDCLVSPSGRAEASPPPPSLLSFLSLRVLLVTLSLLVVLLLPLLLVLPRRREDEDNSFLPSRTPRPLSTVLSLRPSSFWRPPLPPLPLHS